MKPSDKDGFPDESEVIFNVLSPVVKLKASVLGIENVADIAPKLSDLNFVPLDVAPPIPYVADVGVMWSLTSIPSKNTKYGVFGLKFSPVTVISLALIDWAMFVDTTLSDLLSENSSTTEVVTPVRICLLTFLRLTILSNLILNGPFIIFAPLISQLF